MTYVRESMDSREGFQNDAFADYQDSGDCPDFSEPTEAECLAEERDYEEMREVFEWMDEQDELDREEEDREFQAWIETDEYEDDWEL